MADTKGESPAVSQLLSQVSIVKDKLTQKLLSELGFGSVEELTSKVPKNKTNGIEYYTIFEDLYISLDTLKSYPSQEELLADVKKEKIIDKNYSQLQVSEGKVILPSKNKVVKEIDYLMPMVLKNQIDYYQDKINEHNSKLESYEKKLSNDPKTIQLGDHQVKVVKILYKNISRLVVVEGPYQGHYVDELISSTGEVIGSVSKASPTLTETSKTLKSISKSEIESVFTEPIEFSNLQKVSDYVSATNIETHLDKKYVELVDSGIGIKKRNFYNIIGSNILFNIGNESSKIESTLNLIKRPGFGEISINNSTVIGSYDDFTILIERTLHLSRGLPDTIYNNIFKSSPCFSEGLGTRIFTQQVKSASESGFKSIKTYAARGGDYMGYYIWPKVGYNATVSLYRYDAQKENIEPLYNYLEAWLRKNSKNVEMTHREITAPILDIYACKAKDRFIGQELWQKSGNSQDMTFDLTSSSLSMRILEAYVSLKAKKEGLDPKDYLNVDYSRYANYNLECLLDKYIDPEFNHKLSEPTAELLRRLKDSVRNYENGELFRIYQNPKTRPKLLTLLKNLKKIERKLVGNVLLILNQKGYQNIKLASNDQMSEDPMIKEIDESIINQVWDGINKLYESGTFK